MKILLFTPSKHRPLFSRLCLLQMQNQTYPHTHCIFLNTDTPDDTTHNYTDILNDIQIKTNNEVQLAFGRSGDQHQNHMTAITLEKNWEDFDLFLKIDDDDIYTKTYIEDVVNSYKKHQWDFSGTKSEGYINDIQYHSNIHISDLGLSDEEIALGVPKLMPSTFAFTKKAIQKLMNIPAIKGWEDIAWRKLMVTNPEIKVHVREHSNYTYNVHGKNVSTSHHHKNNS
jgi:hypothetical protein